jgi:NAD(P)-dependent dehydrogenase (short-subunit alcohol dehydrogenase family)
VGGGGHMPKFGTCQTLVAFLSRARAAFSSTTLAQYTVHTPPTHTHNTRANIIMGSSTSKTSSSPPLLLPTSSTSSLSGSSTGDDVVAVLGAHARGRSVLVTGAASGLGLETARVLLCAGADVTIAVLPHLMDESVASLQHAVAAAAAAAAAAPPGTLTALPLDLASLDSVRACAESYAASGRPLDILINNAGVMAVPLLASADGHELQFAVNYLGHFLLTQLLLPLLSASSSARVVNISSAAHVLLTPPEGLPWALLGRHADAQRPTYHPWVGYGQSKLCLVLHTAELQRRSDEAGWGVTACAVHPGAVLWTGLKRHVGLRTVAQMCSFPSLWRFTAFSERPVTKSIAQGVATALTAALDPAARPGGYYANCSPVPQGYRYISRLVEDREACARLWALSEELTEKGAKARS